MLLFMTEQIPVDLSLSPALALSLSPSVCVWSGGEEGTQIQWVCFTKRSEDDAAKCGC